MLRYIGFMEKPLILAYINVAAGIAKLLAVLSINISLYAYKGMAISQQNMIINKNLNFFTKRETFKIVFFYVLFRNLWSAVVKLIHCNEIALHNKTSSHSDYMV